MTRRSVHLVDGRHDTSWCLEGSEASLYTKCFHKYGCLDSFTLKLVDGDDDDYPLVTRICALHGTAVPNRGCRKSESMKEKYKYIHVAVRVQTKDDIVAIVTTCNSEVVFVE